MVIDHRNSILKNDKICLSDCKVQNVCAFFWLTWSAVISKSNQPISVGSESTDSVNYRQKIL